MLIDRSIIKTLRPHEDEFVRLFEEVNKKRLKTPVERPSDMFAARLNELTRDETIAMWISYAAFKHGGAGTIDIIKAQYVQERPIADSGEEGAYELVKNVFFTTDHAYSDSVIQRILQLEKDDAAARERADRKKAEV